MVNVLKKLAVKARFKYSKRIFKKEPTEMKVTKIRKQDSRD